MKFSTKYGDRYRDAPESIPQESLVETAGYIPAQKRIENMMLAGQRLSDYRKSQFDFPDGKVDEKFSDPTRSRNFDLSDATRISQDLSSRIAQVKASGLKQTVEKPVDDSKQNSPE